jgi:hypothetical protein
MQAETESLQDSDISLHQMGPSAMYIQWVWWMPKILSLDLLVKEVLGARLGS